MGFRSEEELTNKAMLAPFFTELLTTSETKVLMEPRGLFGIPDVVVARIDGCATTRNVYGVAFEMKIANWRRALMQAYRYRNFAQRSYVVLDKKHVRPALSHIHRFHNSNVGLISIDMEGSAEVHFHPEEDTPFCTRMTNLLREMVLKESVISQEHRKDFIMAVYFPTAQAQAA